MKTKISAMPNPMTNNGYTSAVVTLERTSANRS